MRDCRECYWRDKCGDTETCEHYDSVYDSDARVIREYEQVLRERVEDYQEIIDEFND